MTAELRDPFNASYLKNKLGRRSLRASGALLAAQGAKFILNLVSLAILARLLKPADFGLVAMVLPIYRFATTFQDLGLTSATIHREALGHREVSTLYWINCLASLLLALAIALSAPLIAGFYGRPETQAITWAFAAMLLLPASSAQHMALLQRHMRIARISMIETAGLIAGMAAGAMAALAGAGHWALVIGPAVTEAVKAAGIWQAARWRPGLPHWSGEARQMLGFGTNISLATVCQWANRNMDNVLIGKFWGDAALGVYSRAYSVLLLPLSQVNAPMNRVVLPALSRLQAEPERFRQFYLQACGMTVSLTMPVVAFLSVDAEPALRLVLGEGWGGAVIIFQALAPAAFLGTFNAATGWAYASLGRTGRQLTWALIQSPVILGFFCLGLPFGAVGVAAAYSAATLTLRIPSLAYCFHGTPVRVPEFLLALMPAAAASIAAAMMLALMRQFIPPPESSALHLIADAPVYAAAYAAIYLCFPAGRENVRALRRKLA